MSETRMPADGGRTKGSVGLTVLLAGLSLAVVAALVVAVGTLAESLTGDRTVAVRIPADEVDVSVPDAALTIEELAGTVEASRGTVLVAAAGGALEAMSAAVAAGALALLVRSARSGDPFGSANVTRLRVAVAASVVGLIGAMVGSVGHLLATEDAGLTPVTEIGFAWPAAILVFAALSQVWSAGVALRDDVELTI